MIDPIERAALTDVPLIDIAPFLRAGSQEERQRAAQVLRSACIDIGFFYLGGHGFAAEELEAVLVHGRRFFSLPIEEKMKLDARLNPRKLGFVRTGGLDPEKTRGTAFDIKERLYMARELETGEPERGRVRAGMTAWPAPAAIPGFEPTMKAYIARLLDLSMALGRAFALSLDLAEDYFDPHYRYPDITLALNYYPPFDGPTRDPARWSFSPHTDFGGFTILLQDTIGGLQARNASGQWIDVPPRAGTFVVNIGDLFARWTNDLYVSTLHRGVNPANVARMSAAFFVSPNGASVVRCIDTCQSPDNPARYEAVESEAFTHALIAQSESKGRPGMTAETARRVQAS